MGRRYDHPNFLIRREAFFQAPAGASGTYGGYTPQQKMKLVAVHSVVQIAGTNVAANAFTVRAGVNGTTSIGAIPIGTSTAGAVSHVSIGSTIDRGEMLNLLQGADAAGVTNFTYEFEVLPDALLT